MFLREIFLLTFWRSKTRSNDATHAQFYSGLLGLSGQSLRNNSGWDKEGCVSWVSVENAKVCYSGKLLYLRLSKAIMIVMELLYWAIVDYYHVRLIEAVCISDIMVCVLSWCVVTVCLVNYIYDLIIVFASSLLMFVFLCCHIYSYSVWRHGVRKHLIFSRGYECIFWNNENSDTLGSRIH